jgi:dGTPase
MTPDRSRGRLHDDPFMSRAASPFVLDRERVVHCSAFRRLEYKTQVFVNHESDHFRTRLTHTLEVAHLARRLAEALGLDTHLAEVIALAHDLGHPPFGHAGETVLDALMAEHGGFEHNAQAFRVVTELERPFPDFRGLNLSFEVRESLLKHRTVHDHPRPAGLEDGVIARFYAVGPHPPVEAQLVALADRIAYDGHDLEDGLEAGLLNADVLGKAELWRRHAEPIVAAHASVRLPALRRPILDAIQNALLDDAVATTAGVMADAGVSSVDAVRRHDVCLAGFSVGIERSVEQLETVLREAVYGHPRLVRMDTKARGFIERMFEAYRAEPRLLPARYVRRMDGVGRERVICDYLAGMTDRFCQDEYKRLFEPFERV